MYVIYCNRKVIVLLVYIIELFNFFYGGQGKFFGVGSNEDENSMRISISISQIKGQGWGRVYFIYKNVIDKS